MKLIKKTLIVTRGPKLSQALSPSSLKAFPSLIKIALVNEALNHSALF